MYRRLTPTLVVLVAACGETTPPDAPPPAAPLPPVEVVRGSQPGLPSNHPAVADLQVASRGPRRLSVEELERTWEAVAGIGVGQVQLPENLARSLGDPDWMSVTEPSLEPSPLFMKFMVDLGAILCTQILQADRLRVVEDRVLLRYANDVERNLQSLMLRFWAVDALTDDPELAKLRNVYEQGRQGAGGDPSGWLAVCLALSTAPEFLLY